MVRFKRCQFLQMLVKIAFSQLCFKSILVHIVAAATLPSIFHILSERWQLILREDKLCLEVVAGVGLVQGQGHHVVLRSGRRSCRERNNEIGSVTFLFTFYVLARGHIIVFLTATSCTHCSLNFLQLAKNFPGLAPSAVPAM